MKRIPLEGTIIGDTEVIEYVGDRQYMCRCTKCGKIHTLYFRRLKKANELLCQSCLFKKVRGRDSVCVSKRSKQPVDFDICKRNLLLKLNHELDKSKKGSVDEPIVSLVEYLNQTKDYCTTS